MSFDIEDARKDCDEKQISGMHARHVVLSACKEIESLRQELELAQRVISAATIGNVHHPRCAMFDDKEAECSGCTRFNKALIEYRSLAKSAKWTP